MDGICEVKIDFTPLTERIAADVEAARRDDTPGGKTVTAEERDGIEKRAEAAFAAVGNQMLQIPHPCSTIAGGVILRGARETAKALVKSLIDGEDAPQAPRQQPAPGPTERAPRTPLRPTGRTLEA